MTGSSLSKCKSPRTVSWHDCDFDSVLYDVGKMCIKGMQFANLTFTNIYYYRKLTLLHTTSTAAHNFKKGYNIILITRPTYNSIF
jgi:hypothetical protein